MQQRSLTCFTRLTPDEMAAYRKAAQVRDERPSVLLREAVKHLVIEAGVDWPRRTVKPKEASK